MKVLKSFIIASQWCATFSFAPHLPHNKYTHTFSRKTTSIASANVSLLDTIQSLFQPSQSSNFMNKQEIENTKNKLLESCREGSGRKEIESIMKELESLSPMKGTAESSKLQKKWKMEWTTEKEINLFVDWNLSNYVYQTISGNEIKNGIEFKNGGGLFVSGSLSVPEDEMYEGKRTNFEFTTATLDLAKWGAFTIPPVGAGWFETIYLDDELRVDINSRNDILICTCE